MLTYVGIGAGYYESELVHEIYTGPNYNDSARQKIYRQWRSQALTFAVEFGSSFRTSPRLVFFRYDWETIEPTYGAGLALELFYRF